MSKKPVKIVLNSEPDFEDDSQPLYSTISLDWETCVEYHSNDCYEYSVENAFSLLQKVYEMWKKGVPVEFIDESEEEVQEDDVEDIEIEIKSKSNKTKEEDKACKTYERLLKELNIK